MSTPFNPYHIWLGIPPEEQPANLYRLLSLKAFESSADAISSAADRQMAHVRTFQGGQYAQLSQKILNELAHARVTLLNPEKKREYDRQLATEINRGNGIAGSWKWEKTPDRSKKVEPSVRSAGVSIPQPPPPPTMHKPEPQVQSIPPRLRTVEPPIPTLPPIPHAQEPKVRFQPPKVQEENNVQKSQQWYEKLTTEKKQDIVVGIVSLCALVLIVLWACFHPKSFWFTIIMIVCIIMSMGDASREH